MSETNLYQLIFSETYEISEDMKHGHYATAMEHDQLIGKYIAYHDLINKAGLVSEYGLYKKAMQG
ncbi:MAG: hypothetical protein PUC71_02965 [Oscillospiraceae bacterium]|jgi:hypothetical protein|nr:hypothetical protein [Oscillospiraceae bacterium]